MEINVLIDEEFEKYLKPERLQSVAEQILIIEGVSADAELSLVIVDEEQVQQLNRDYRRIDEPTDVLAFSLLPVEKEAETASPSFVIPPDGKLHLGEVIISYPQAVMQAEERQHSAEREINILLIHGVLHLLGYDHETPELEGNMTAREAAILSRIEGGES